MSDDLELNRRDLLGLAKLILIELDKIKNIYDKMFEQLAKERDDA